MLFFLSSLAGADPDVRIGPDHFLYVNDQPLLVIGAYALPKSMDLAEAKAMGFNLVHGPADPSFLDRARTNDLYVWHSFGGGMDFAEGDVEAKKKSLQTTVQQAGTHPALLFWESVDEPAWTDRRPAEARVKPEGLAAGYRFLKSLDPHHPVYLNHAPRNTVETLRMYNPAADIVCVDIYPIIPPGLPQTYAITPDGRQGDLPNQTPSCVGEFVDKMKQVAESRQAVFIVLQGFSWGTTVEGDRQKQFLRYPNYRESRFMAWNALIHGANGLMVWGLQLVPPGHPFLNDLSRVLQEVRALSPVILNHDSLPPPSLHYHERGSTIAAGIETLCRRSPDGLTLVAANTSIDPAAADFTAPWLPASGIINVRGENRTVPVRQGSFTDEFQGLEVHVYHLQP